MTKQDDITKASSVILDMHCKDEHFIADDSEAETPLEEFNSVCVFF